MHNVHIRKLNSLGVTNVGNGDLIDFLSLSEGLRDFTKKMGNNFFVTLYVFDFLNHLHRFLY